MIWLAVVGTLNQSNAITMMSLLWWGALTNQNHSWPAGVYRGSLPREVTAGGSMIWLAVVGTLNQSNAITMMSLLWWGALTNQNHSWPTGVYCRSLLQEFTMGGYRGSLPREFTVGGSMIWLAVVGTLNQSNAITMMSLLWWRALTNQNHSWPVGVHHGRLPRKITAGVYRRRSPWEFTTEDHCGSLHGRSPREFTTEDHRGSLLWKITVGIYHKRSLWEFTAEDHCGSLLWKITAGVYMEDHSGSLPRKITAGVYCGRSLWEFTTRDHCGSSLRKITVGVYCGRSLREFTAGDHHRRSLWEITAGVYRRRSPWEFTTEDHHRSTPRKITAGVYTDYTYHWLPLATIYFVGDNREFEV